MKRLLTPVERSLLLGDLPSDYGAAFNFCLMLRIRGSFSDDDLRQALEKSKARHPLLAVRIAADDPAGPCLTTEGVPPFTLKVLSGAGETDWVAVVEDELGLPFLRQAGTMARFTLLRGEGFSDLVITCDHGTSDGLSGAFLARDILQALGDPTFKYTPVPFPPDLWDAMPASLEKSPSIKARLALMSLTFKLQSLWRSLKSPTASQPALPPQINRDVPAKPTGPLANPDRPPVERFCLIPRLLTIEQTSRLVERCRKENTSVNAALCAAWLIAYANFIPDRQTWVRKVSCPVNLRPRLQPPVGETSGLFISIATARVDCAPAQSFWQVARQLKHGLQKASTDEGLLYGYLVMKLLFKNADPAALNGAFEKYVGGPADYDFSVTNLGRLDLPTQTGPVQVVAFYGPLVNSSELEKTVGASTANGQMSISLLYRHSRLTPQQGEELMACALAHLLQAATG